jgi:hypothetical protein
MAKTKTAAANKTTSTEKMAIPSAVRDKAPAVDLLSELTGAAPAAAPKKSTGRPSLPLTPQVESLFTQHIKAKVLADHFGSHSENVKAELKSEIWPIWLKNLWAQKSKPANPTLKSNNPKGQPDCEGMYIIQEKYKITITSAEEAINSLVDLGLEKNDAERLVKNELDFSPTVAINFNQLQNGRYDSESKGWVDSSDEEKAVANKALKLLLSKPDAEPLTSADIALLINRTPKIAVNDGFLQRVTTYVHSYEQLAAVFKVITPVEMAKGAKFGISDSLQERNARLIEEAGNILGVKVALVTDKKEVA